LRLSIIIPTWNEAANISAAVMRARELDPHEVLVADGGSSDGTLETASGLPCRVIRTPRGRAVQQNLAAAAASGDVLLFLHADCWLAAPGRMQMEQALRSPRIPGGAFRHRIDSAGLLFRAIETGDSLRVASLRIAYGDQGIFLRRTIFERLGGFPDVRLMEEILLMRRLKHFGRLALLPGPLHCSPRRWLRHGPIRQTLRNWLLLSAEKLGVHPDRLATLYAPHATVPVAADRQE